MTGNISRQALTDGAEAVEEEFYAKVPPLMEEGGILPPKPLKKCSWPFERGRETRKMHSYLANVAVSKFFDNQTPLEGI